MCAGNCTISVAWSSFFACLSAKNPPGARKLSRPRVAGRVRETGCLDAPGTAQCRRPIGLAQRRDDLNNKLSDNQRQQGVQDAASQRLDPRMRNLLETRAVVTGLKPLEPVGLSRAAIAMLAMLLSDLLGLPAAFGLEFRDRFRIALDEANGEPVATEMSAVVK